MKLAQTDIQAIAQAVVSQIKPLLAKSKRLYTVPEASVYLGRSVWSIRELIWKGDLPSVRAGRRIHLDINDLDAFIEKNKVCEQLP